MTESCPIPNQRPQSTLPSKRPAFAFHLGALCHVRPCAVQVVCAEAPVRLQEVWVSSLVRGFSLSEANKTRQLSKEVEAAQKLVPPGHAAWDNRLAQQVGALVQRIADGEGIAGPGTGSGAGGKSSTNSSSNGSSSSSGGHASAALPLMPEGLQAGPAAADLVMTTAFKVSRAVAAAGVQPGQQAAAALAAQAALQPLKYAHFEKRALHLARQLKELCRRWVCGLGAILCACACLVSWCFWDVHDGRKRKDFGQSSLPTTASSSSDCALMRMDIRAFIMCVPCRQAAALEQKAGAQAAGQGQRVPISNSSRQSQGQGQVEPAVVVAVIGRQYIPSIQRLWDDPSSELWLGDVPRTFAPST